MNDPLDHSHDDDIIEDVNATDTPIEPNENDDVIDETVKSEPDDDDVGIDEKLSIEDENYEFDTTSIELRGVAIEDISKILTVVARNESPSVLDSNARQVGTWENILFRMAANPQFEEIRTQDALASFDMSEEERAKLTSVYRDKSKNIVLRMGRVIKNPSGGEIKALSAEDARIAFEAEGTGGVTRVLLYNSGLSVDIVTPTGTDLETMFANCAAVDKELGSSLGANYFTYGDVALKAQIINFLEPLIRNSSYNEWRKEGRLWSLIKLPDLYHLVAAVASICYPDGYDNFVVPCTNPETKDKEAICKFVETLKIDITKMIVTRFSSMSVEALEHMSATRTNAKHTATQIAKYQADLGFEGEEIKFGNTILTMRIPTISEHLEAGRIFLADIINDIEGDNNISREKQIGIRYIRTFLPWIAKATRINPDNSGFSTDDGPTIVRRLERLEDQYRDGSVREKLLDFINRTQLTYVGYPNTPCPNCKHVASTPSGMRTIDPFNTFFILAFLYTKADVSSKTQAV